MENELMKPPFQLPEERGLTEKHIEYARALLAPKGTRDDVLFLFEMAQGVGLNPWTKEIGLIPFYDEGSKSYKMTPYIGIDGLRKVGVMSKRFAYERAEFSSKPDGTLDACTVHGIQLVAGTWKPVQFTAPYDEFCQTTRDQQSGKIRPNRNWAKRPRHMLWKCAQAHLIRVVVGGINLHIPEELGYVDAEIVRTPAPALTENTTHALPAPEEDFPFDQPEAAPDVPDMPKVDEEGNVKKPEPPAPAPEPVAKKSRTKPKAPAAPPAPVAETVENELERMADKFMPPAADRPVDANKTTKPPEPETPTIADNTKAAIALASEIADEMGLGTSEIIAGATGKKCRSIADITNENADEIKSALESYKAMFS